MTCNDETGALSFPGPACVFLGQPARLDAAGIERQGDRLPQQQDALASSRIDTDAFSTIELAGMQEFADRRPVEFFEIALRVAIRLAPMAEPADVERKILRNYIAVARERPNAEYATREVIQHLVDLAEKALQEDRYEKFLQVLRRLGQERRRTR